MNTELLKQLEALTAMMREYAERNAWIELQLTMHDNGGFVYDRYRRHTVFYFHSLPELIEKLKS